MKKENKKGKCLDKFQSNSFRQLSNKENFLSTISFSVISRQSTMQFVRLMIFFSGEFPSGILRKFCQRYIKGNAEGQVLKTPTHYALRKFTNRCFSYFVWNIKISEMHKILSIQHVFQLISEFSSYHKHL